MVTPHRILLLFLLATTLTTITSADQDNYCGNNWMAASSSCSTPCPNNLDSECPEEQTCQGYTGCSAKLSQPETAQPVVAPPQNTPTAEPTAEPTKRTKRPTSNPTTGKPTVTATAAPVDPTFIPPTASPIGTPTAAPIVRPLLEGVTTISQYPNYNNGGENTILSTTTQRSYGIIFEVQTTEDSPAIRIQNLEFYSPLLGANVAYEVWTKKGTWHGFEGQDRKFQKISSGNVTTSSTEGEMTRFPSKTTIKVDGAGSRQSIYLTLSTKHMLYAHSTSDEEDTTQSIMSIEEINEETQDTIILVQTPDLIVYEGAAVMTFPFEKAEQRIFYRMPRGFVGKIWYHRNPCNDVKETFTNETDGSTWDEWRNVKTWEECAREKKQEPIPQEVTQIPEYILNGESSEEDGGGPSNNTTLSEGFNGTAPTVSPSTSPAPTINTMKVNLILTLENVAENRVLTLAEQSAFEKTTIEFYEVQDLLDLNEVEIWGSKIHYQQIFVDSSDEGSKNTRGLQVEGPVTPEGIASLTDEEEWIRSILSLEVTLVVSIMYSPLPQQITQELLQTLLINNEIQLTRTLRSHPELAGYFGTLDGIPSVLAVDRVTDAPTMSPTDSPTPEVSEEVEEVITLSTPMIVAIIAGIIYTSLAILSMFYVKRGRQRIVKARQWGKGSGIADSATSFIGHGMKYDGDTKMTDKEDEKSFFGNGKLRKSDTTGTRSLFGKGSPSRSSNKKKLADTERMNNNAVNQYDRQRRIDEENDNGSYYHSDENGEEELSSMEDSYYSEDESGSEYSEEEESD